MPRVRPHRRRRPTESRETLLEAPASATTTRGRPPGPLAFVIARAAGRPAIDRLVSGRVERVDRWLGDRGLVAVLTLHLVPLVPFDAANYAAGVTAIRLRDFIAGTAVGIVLGVVVYTGLGARASDPTGPWFLQAVGGLVVLAGLGSLSMRRMRTDPGNAPAGARRSRTPNPSRCGHE